MITQDQHVQPLGSSLDSRYLSVLTRLVPVIYSSNLIVNYLPRVDFSPGSLPLIGVARDVVDKFIMILMLSIAEW